MMECRTNFLDLPSYPDEMMRILRHARNRNQMIAVRISIVRLDDKLGKKSRIEVPTKRQTRGGNGGMEAD